MSVGKIASMPLIDQCKYKDVVKIISLQDVSISQKENKSCFIPYIIKLKFLKSKQTSSLHFIFKIAL
jgi:hypothetical protein